ncbi:inositol monophosphatase [Mesosutterella sp. OilRF-GAM-744-9]|uniref:Inositol monophosphatase n=1 Tax=Mesosutterella porci TaxID=2915351 RepID=A0ABS9MQD4_9BURK|nr:inositol monophosphatase family protein [Mesosutterella sp. oilRF-744-WT-GAM-9]MCG5030248.1 inositol monophosphatase [Mesosutterella sp. oilRF-744-WT-GAM-9]
MTEPVGYTRNIGQEELRQFLPFLQELADAAAAEILPNFLTGIHVDEKSNHTPVTRADRGAEKAMRDLIEARFPAHGILGEEWGGKEPAEALPRYRWILDPIDGTRAFISNCFLFGNLIALERDDGEGFGPILSSIAFPAAGVRAIGWKNHAELRRGTGFSQSVPMKVRPCSRLKEATLLVTSHWSTPEQVGDGRIQKLVDQAKLYRTWGDCFGYFAVASGGADIMIDPDLSYWDAAALIPVAEGAGGVITSTKGGNPLIDKSAVCTAGGLHREVLQILNSSSL